MSRYVWRCVCMSEWHWEEKLSEHCVARHLWSASLWKKVLTVLNERLYKLSSWMLPLFSVIVNCNSTATYTATSLQPAMQSSHCAWYCRSSSPLPTTTIAHIFSYSIYCSLCSAGANVAAATTIGFTLPHTTLNRFLVRVSLFSTTCIKE